MGVFDIAALIAMGVVVCGVVYLIIWLGDLPASIAQERDHPQVEAVRALAWLGLLFTGGIAYIVAFVWAFYDYGPSAEQAPGQSAETESLRRRVAELEAALASRGDKS